jgi:hypothetical protein
MSATAQKAIIDPLTTHLSRELCAGIEEGLIAAGRQAHLETASAHAGHRAHSLGQQRHFRSNEQFSTALTGAGIAHNPVCGNDIIIGNVGPLLLGRFATSSKTWNNARRSKQRLNLAEHNRWLERLIQPDFLGQPVITHPTMVVFFVSIYSGSIHVQPEMPLAVEIAVMDTELRTQLFHESIPAFISRFAEPVVQADNVRVHLKVAKKEQQEK